MRDNFDEPFEAGPRSPNLVTEGNMATWRHQLVSKWSANVTAVYGDLLTSLDNDPRKVLEVVGKIFKIHYTATDSTGNKGNSARYVKVVYTKPPAIEVSSKPIIRTMTFNIPAKPPDLEVTAEASDNVNKDTYKVELISKSSTLPEALEKNTLYIQGYAGIDFSEEGTYSIVYTAMDDFNNTARVTQAITMIEPTSPGTIAGAVISTILILGIAAFVIVKRRNASKARSVMAEVTTARNMSIGGGKRDSNTSVMRATAVMAARRQTSNSRNVEMSSFQPSSGSKNSAITYNPVFSTTNDPPNISTYPHVTTMPQTGDDGALCAEQDGFMIPFEDEDTSVYQNQTADDLYQNSSIVAGGKLESQERSTFSAVQKHNSGKAASTPALLSNVSSGQPARKARSKPVQMCAIDGFEPTDIGRAVTVSGKYTELAGMVGILRFVGYHGEKRPTKRAMRCGVEFSSPVGHNDGSVAGTDDPSKSYRFVCFAPI